MLLGWAGRLAVPAAVLAGLFWWQGWTPTGTSALIDFAGFYAGFRLNHMQSSDMWPWLGRGWKLPRHSLISDNRPGRFKLIAIGPLPIVGVALALSYSREGRWEEAAVAAIVGLIFQIMAELWIRSEIRTRSFFEPDAEKVGGGGDDSGCRAVAAEPGGNVSRGRRRSGCVLWRGDPDGGLVGHDGPGRLLGSNDVVCRAGGLDRAGSNVRVFVPALLERLGHSGIGYLGGHAGLSSANDGLFKKLASTPNEKLSAEKSVPAGDRLLVEAFAPDEQKLVLQWLGNIRIGLRARSFRRWSPAPDYAFISYAWADDAQTSVASAIADACAGAGIEHFLDKVALKSREGVFRMPLATGLARSTHVFVVVTPGLASGQVVRREIQMAMGRWRGELLPAVICVVEPGVCEQLATDPSVPVAIRFLLRFCPQMTPAEASQPALVRYVVELTRRQGKWSDSAPTALAVHGNGPGDPFAWHNPGQAQTPGMSRRCRRAQAAQSAGAPSVMLSRNPTVNAILTGAWQFARRSKCLGNSRLPLIDGLAGVARGRVLSCVCRRGRPRSPVSGFSSPRFSGPPARGTLPRKPQHRAARKCARQPARRRLRPAHSQGAAASTRLATPIRSMASGTPRAISRATTAPASPPTTRTTSTADAPPTARSSTCGRCRRRIRPCRYPPMSTSPTSRTTARCCCASTTAVPTSTTG